MNFCDKYLKGQTLLLLINFTNFAVFVIYIPDTVVFTNCRTK